MTDLSHVAAAPSQDGLASLSPAYFGMVMATGIVSIGAQLLGHPMLARGLFALNLVAYAVLCVLNVLRVVRPRPGALAAVPRPLCAGTARPRRLAAAAARARAPRADHAGLLGA